MNSSVLSYFVWPCMDLQTTIYSTSTNKMEQYTKYIPCFTESVKQWSELCKLKPKVHYYVCLEINPLYIQHLQHEHSLFARYICTNMKAIRPKCNWVYIRQIMSTYATTNIFHLRDTPVGVRDYRNAFWVHLN